MRVHYLQHVSFEGLGYIETWLKLHGHSIAGVHFFKENYVIPVIDDIAALVILGGPMGVYDDEKYPWLQTEKIFIKDCIQAGKKVLGICLGAQLMAVCLGAKVSAAENKEIGWYPVMPTDELKNIDWLHKIFKEKTTVFHWHGDKFEIPSGCYSLVTSHANDNQVFYADKNVIGLQFHLEVTEQSLQLMVENSKEELVNAPFIQSAQEIIDGRKYLQICNEMMAKILEKWMETN